MDRKHYHIPVESRPVCPICHKSVYSRAGIHPQCAMIQSEPPRPKKVPHEAAAAAAIGNDRPVAPAVET